MYWSFFTIFSDAIICDCQTVNVVSNKGIQGVYQKLGYVNGRTSWNSSGIAIWFSPTYEGWFFGGIDYLGQNMAMVIVTGTGNYSMAALIVLGTGNNSCPYNISDDQWLYYNSGTSSWQYVNDGDVSVQCLSGNLN